MNSAASDRTVVVLAGTTATGKTALGEALAAALRGVVICADARQLFAELDLGTGKPSAAERAAQPHALFDRWHLGDAVSAGEWARAAAAECETALGAGRTPVLVGGSGLYLRALLEGLHGTPARDAAVRAELEAAVARDGLAAAHARLGELDPVTAARLAVRDRQRILRALEVVLVTGEPLSARHTEPRMPVLAARSRVIELFDTLPAIEQRIALRTRWMFASGLLEETRRVVDSGAGEALEALRAIGYDEALAHLGGECSLDDAIARTDLRTRQFAKRQRTWFRHQLTAMRLPVEGRTVPALRDAALAMLADPPGRV